jgi:hypothetical protein
MEELEFNSAPKRILNLEISAVVSQEEAASAFNHELKASCTI